MATFLLLTYYLINMMFQLRSDLILLSLALTYHMLWGLVVNEMMFSGWHSCMMKWIDRWDPPILIGFPGKSKTEDSTSVVLR
jgi:hypothetical protein